MGDEAKVGGGNEEVSESDRVALADIVNDAWPGEATELDNEHASPDARSAAAETDEGVTDEKKTDATAATRSELLTDEQLGKLTLADVENPAFDWSKVPPAQTALLKKWQADATRYRQQIADAKKAPGSQKPPQPTEETPDPVDTTNREIVEKALKDMGLAPEVISEVIADQVTAKGVALAAQNVPRFTQDEKFHGAVINAITQNEYLASLADSKDPAQIARAIQLAAVEVENTELRGQVSSFDQRVADLDAREKQIAAKEAEVEQERAKLNRHKPTISGGKSPGGAAPSKDTGSVREIVDTLDFPSTGLRIG
jgi:hypothetical protein